MTLAPVAPAATQVSLSTPSVDFGDVAVGAAATSKNVLISSNAGAVTFDVNTGRGGMARGMTIGGVNAGDFSIDATTCTAQIPARGNCEVTLGFRPGAAGARAGTLTISNDGGNSPQAVALTGTGNTAATVAGKSKSKATPAAGGSNGTGNAAASTSQPSQSNNSPAPTGASPLDCTAVTSDAPCTISRNVIDYDREFWDIGLGLSIPGVRERTYDASDLTSKPTIVTHTDLYGFFDFYFTGNRNSAIPHFDFGLPLTGQPFHRPFLGLAFPITTWFHLSNSVPFTLNVLAGAVPMRQDYVTVDPTATGGLALKAERTWKPMFAVELPLNQLIGRVAKLGK